MKWQSTTPKKALNKVNKLFVVLLIVYQLSGIALCEPIPSVGTAEVFFSPRGGATEAIVKEINHTKSEILIQAYSFTSAPIAKALLEAHKRGVKIEAVLDKSQRSEKYTSATFLLNEGIPVLIDDKHQIAHSKIFVIDRQTIITGSFNFTKAAEEKNAENLLILKGNKPLVDQYLQNFEDHKAHSVKYEFKPKARKSR